MHRNSIPRAGAAIALLALAGLATAQAETPQPETTTEAAAANLPDGFDLLERHIEAVGGVEKVKDIEGLRITGSFKMPAMGMTGGLFIQLKAPHFMAVEVTLPNDMGIIEQGADGEQAWASLGPNMPVQVVEGDQARALMDQARFQDEYQPRKAYQHAKTLGEEMFGGEKVYRVELQRKDQEQKSIALFSVDSGLRVGEKGKSTPSSPTYDLTTTFDDYREVEGVLMAHTIVASTPQFEQIIEFTKIDVNPTFEDGIFDPPGAL